MPFGEARGHPKFSKKIIGIAAFVHTEITLKLLNAQCATLEKVIISLFYTHFTKITHNKFKWGTFEIRGLLFK